ncbi:MAG: beta-lactamase family protein [Flavobacteriaceae bacterium]|nr:beta-lactamase family protein [Flavobacteriaceae bacterium]
MNRPINMPDETAQGPTVEEELQSIISAKVGPDKLLGVSVSIRVDGVEHWQLTGGTSKANEPIQPEMRFGIASITKTVVAATILRLEEDGLLSITDSIHNHLSLNSPNVDENITLFQLLNHQSGLKGYFQHPDIWPSVEGDLQTGFPASQLVQYIGEPVFAAGERYEYSNSNFLILGLIIEAVTGQSVAEVMREKFWDPLGLNAMYFGASEPIEGILATPWRDNNGDGVLQDILADFGPAYHSVFFTAADVFATASDLSMWAFELFNGDAITAASRFKMLTFLQLDDPIANGYGLGVRRVLLAGRNTFGHTGGMRGYGSYMFYDPRTRVSIAMLNNQSRSENGPLLRYQLVEELLNKVFDEVN